MHRNCCQQSSDKLFPYVSLICKWTHHSLQETVISRGKHSQMNIAIDLRLFFSLIYNAVNKFIWSICVVDKMVIKDSVKKMYSCEGFVHLLEQVFSTTLNRVVTCSYSKFNVSITPQNTALVGYWNSQEKPTASGASMETDWNRTGSTSIYNVTRKLIAHSPDVNSCSLLQEPCSLHSRLEEINFEDKSMNCYARRIDRDRSHTA